MEIKNEDDYLLLIKTNSSIDTLTKSFVSKWKKSELNKLKWLYLLECKINEESYLAVTLNALTFSVIKKLKKKHWVLAHKYILKDKFHNQKYKVISNETGLVKYKLINAIAHCKVLDDNISVEINLWEQLDLEKQEMLEDFLFNLRKARKIDFNILGEILVDVEEAKIAYQISEQANSYKKNSDLFKIAELIFEHSGGIMNIVDFNMEDNNINFIVKDNSLIDQKKINQLEIVKKIKFNDDNLISLILGQEPERTYEVMQKFISAKVASLNEKG